MFQRLRDYLILPATISDFELRYLTRINRIALVFFCAHLPLMVTVALLAGTSVIRATVQTTLVLVGPTVAYRTLTNPRAIARVFAFAAMCMGGVLVHVGQGPMQIEMHFYFFVLIGLLAVFGDPVVILVAAVTVALHHLALFVVLPSSVFNYEASAWTVFVHALFVVLESVAACFVARNFFDNVIGLERIVGERTTALASRNDQLRAVMDNVAAGLVTVDLDGSMSTERSLALERWLGTPMPGEPFWDYVGRSDAAAAMWLEMSWDMLRGDPRLVALALQSCPRHIAAGARTLGLTVAVLGGGAAMRLLVMVQDVTDELERTRLEGEQREVAALCEHALKDPRGVAEFMEETGAMVAALVSRGAGSDVLRLLHTVKGNASIFGAASVATLCHALEERVADDGALGDDDLAMLSAAWTNISRRLGSLLGVGLGKIIVEPEEHAAAVRSLRSGVSVENVARRIDAWRFERVDQRLSRVADQARGIAHRLARAPLEVVVEHEDVRLPEEDLSAFWASIVHLVRNAVDHGIETAEERVACGKRAGGRLVLRALRDGAGFAIEVEDDGRGIDWQRVAERARALGLPASTHADLTAALFTDGLSTRQEATLFSGRGIGMSAVRAECERIGATLAVLAPPGAGTRVRITVPMRSRQAA